MDDLISRQAAIDAIKGLLDSMLETDTIGSYEIENVLFEVPSAQTEPQWIPCSKRLPKKPNMYTVTDSKGDVVRFVFDGTESSREYWLRCAKAWMPLPEPYKAEE